MIYGPDGRHMYSNGGAKRPNFFVTGGFLNEPKVEFVEGAATYLSSSFTTETVPTVTMGFLYYLRSAPAGDNYIFGGGPTTRLDIAYDTGNAATYLYRGGFASFTRGNEVADGWHYLVVLANGANSSVKTDTELDTGDCGAQQNLDSYYMGNAFTMGISEGGNIDMVETILYKENKFTDVINYFRNRTGKT